MNNRAEGELKECGLLLMFSERARDEFGKMNSEGGLLWNVM